MVAVEARSAMADTRMVMMATTRSTTTPLGAALVVSEQWSAISKPRKKKKKKSRRRDEKSKKTQTSQNSCDIYGKQFCKLTNVTVETAVIWVFPLVYYEMFIWSNLACTKI